MKSIKLYQFSIIYGFAIFVAACTATKLPNKERIELYNAYIEEQKLEQVDRISSFRFDRWTPLGSQHLILYRRFNEPFLITLKRSCYDLDFANSIGVSYNASTLSAKFDYVTVPNNIPVKCFIDTIHKLDKEQKKEMLAIGRLEEREGKVFEGDSTPSDESKPSA